MHKKIRGILLVILIIVIFINYKSIIKVFYPIKYSNIVEKYSAEYKLDKYMVYSLIRVESKFNPSAESSRNATGLMQITPQTGRYLARLIGDENFKRDDLFDPDTNIRYGCFYFSKLLKDFDNNIDCAIAAYNGGEGNVRKWLQIDKYGKRSLNSENITFGETKNYLKKVNAYYEIYKFLYSDKHYKGFPKFVR